MLRYIQSDCIPFKVTAFDKQFIYSHDTQVLYVLKLCYISFQVTSYWLPLIDECLGPEHNVPVILVGNRCDMLENSNLDVSFAYFYLYSSLGYFYGITELKKSKSAFFELFI